MSTARKPSLQPVQRAASLGERVYDLLREHLYSVRVRSGEPLRALEKHEPQEAAAAMRCYLSIARTAIQQVAGGKTARLRVA